MLLSVSLGNYIGELKLVSVELSGFFLPGQAAKILDVHRITVQRWLRTGKLQSVLVAGQRMITMSELERVKKERAKADGGG